MNTNNQSSSVRSAPTFYDLWPTARRQTFAVLWFCGAVLGLSREACSASKVVETVDWATPSAAVKTQPDGALAGKVLAAEDGQPARVMLTFPAAGDLAGARCVAKFTRPQISQDRYAIRGRIRYQNVTQPGYVEMWHHNEQGRAAFARTLDNAGPLQKIVGDSPWREFVTPMSLVGSPAPALIELNIVLPAAGEVELASLEVVDGFDLSTWTTPGAWWSDRDGGMLGGVFGTIFGIGGALVGWLASRGQARSLVVGMLKVAIGIGSAGLVLSIIAITQRQPYGVWYPLALVGVLATAIPIGGLVKFSRLYAERELQQMNAADSR